MKRIMTLTRYWRIFPQGNAGGEFGIKEGMGSIFDMLSVYAPTEAVCSLSDNFMGDWKLTAGRVLEVVFLPGVERRGSIRFPMWRKR